MYRMRFTDQLWLCKFETVALHLQNRIISFESSESIIAKGTNRDFTTSVAPFLLFVFFFTETGPTRDDEVFMCSFAVVVLRCYL